MIKERLNFSLWLVAFILLLLVGFEYFIAADLVPHVDFNYFILIIFIIQSLIPLTWIPVTSGRPSVLIKWVIYFVVVIPAIIIPYVSIEYSELGFFSFNCMLLLSFYIVCSFEKIRLFAPPKFKVSVAFFYIVFFSFYLLFLINAVRIFGFNFSLVSLRDVYDVRYAYKEQLEGASFAGTQIRWLLFIFNPFLIILGYLDRKKVWMLVVGIVGELFIYSISGLKSALFISFVLLIILFALSKVRDLSKIPSLIIKLLVFFFGIVLVLDFIFFQDSIFFKNILTSLTIRRNFVLTGHLSGQYFSFFDSNPKNFMANNNVLGYLVNYQSSYNGQSPPDIIGAYAFGSYSEQGRYANANIWADAFAQYGFIGMILIAFFLGLFLHIYDSVAKYSGFKLAIVMLVPFAFTFSNSAFFTVLVGHGALLALLILTLYTFYIRK